MGFIERKQGGSKVQSGIGSRLALIALLVVGLFIVVAGLPATYLVYSNLPAPTEPPTTMEPTTSSTSTSTTATTTTEASTSTTEPTTTTTHKNTTTTTTLCVNLPDYRDPNDEWTCPLHKGKEAAQPSY